MKAIRWVNYAMVATIGVVLSGGPAQGQTMSEHAHAKTSLSTSLTLDVEGRATTLSVAELRALPQKTVTVHNARTNTNETYSGVALSDLLAKYGAAFDKQGQKQILHSYLRVEGTDHYFVVYSGEEIQGAGHNGDVIVATNVNGKDLGDDGEIKLVASGDKKPMRWVRNLAKITLVTVN